MLPLLLVLGSSAPRWLPLIDPRLGRVPAATVATALAPLWFAALAVPLLLPLLARSFYSLAVPLAWLVSGVGGLMVTWRLRALAQGVGPGRYRPAMAVGLIVLCGLLLVPTRPAPQGDEPHYLLVAHSLWEDGDLDLADEYGTGAYADFHPTFLSPHYKPGLEPGSRYSMHGVGYGLLLLPSYAFGRLLSPRAPVLLARMMQVLLFGLFCWWLGRLVAEFAGDRAACCAIVAVGVSSPLLPAPWYLFPETAAMTASCGATWLLWRHGSGVRHWIGAGAMLAALPWLGVKYIPLALTLALVAPWAGEARSRGWATLGALVPLAVGLALHGVFTWRLYGTLSPAAVYLGSDPEFGRAAGYGADWAAYLADWPGALRSLSGYFLDQKEGLLAVGPHYLLAAIGVPWLIRSRRRLGVLLLLAMVAHLAPYALSQQAGGQSPPARPIMPVLWCLAVPLGVALATPVRGLAAFLSGALPVLAVAILGGQILDPSRLPHDYGVAASWLLRELSPRGTELWRGFPLLISHHPHLVVSATWALAVGFVVWLLLRSAQGAPPSRGESRPSAWVFASATLMVLLLGLVGITSRQWPLTDRHIGRPIGDGVEAWVQEAVPPLAYLEPGGVWAPPGAAVELLLLTREPLSESRIWLRTLVPASVRLDLEGRRRLWQVDPEAPVSVDPRVLGVRRPQGWLYRMSVQSSAGAVPARLTGGADYRLLGVHVRLERRGSDTDAGSGRAP